MAQSSRQGVKAIILLFGETFQEICNIPFAAATTGKRARPSGNSIDIKTLLKQTLDIASPGTTAMAHNHIGRIGIFRVHNSGKADLLTE